MSQRRWRSARVLSHLQCTTVIVGVTTSNVLHLHQNSYLHSLPPLSQGETTLLEYAERRQRFFEHLPPHSITILPAADEVACSHDIMYPYRQDSLWYHLFGLHTPLCRQLDPPSATPTEDVRTTMAVFAKAADSNTHVLLCVPPPTINPAAAVWASETVPLSAYESMLTPRAQSQAEKDRTVCTSAVITNDVSSICEALYSLIAQMATRQITKFAGRLETSSLLQKLTVEQRVAHDRSELLRIMPQLFALYPQQLRWGRRQYRLPKLSSLNKRGRDGTFLENGSKTPAQTFHHPLEALFHTINSTALTVHLHRRFFDRTPQPPWDVAIFHYKAASAYTPGLVSTFPRNPSSETGKLNERQISIGAPAPNTFAAASIVTTPTDCGHVSLPICRADTYVWWYRLVKSPSQVRQHLRSARATEHAFVNLMQHARQTVSEHELHCAFQRSVCECSAHFGSSSRVRSAYVPVIASGVRSTDIHYTDNCADGVAGTDVVRVDAGVEVENVPTDCTRTFPIGTPVFMSPQLVDLYDGLLRIQRTLLRRIAPGVAVGDVARLHLDETRALLCALGVDVRQGGQAAAADCSATLAQVSPEENKDNVAERQVPMSLVRSCFCAHTFGHLFGLDIHEEWSSAATAAPAPSAAASANPPHILQGGMMHTVEPGIYMPSLARGCLFGLAAPQLPPAFHSGVGVQVEDDVLVLPPSERASNSNHDDDSRSAATPLNESVNMSCPWSRGTYLQHALAAFERYFYYDHGCSSSGTKKALTSSLQAPSVVVLLCQEHSNSLIKEGIVAVAPPAHEWNVVCFLFSQRLAIDGYDAAVATLAHDVTSVHQLRFRASPAYGEAALLVPEAADTTWYPYDIVVLTASVPKDRKWMESLMRQAGQQRKSR